MAIAFPAGADATSTSTVAEFALGTQAYDTDNNIMWVYIQAAEALDQYDVVAADEAFAASQMTSTEAGDAWKPGVVPIAFASGAYGWMQVKGPVTFNALDVSADTVLVSSATGGALNDVTTAGTRIQGIVALAASTITTKNAVSGFMAIEPFCELPPLA